MTKIKLPDDFDPSAFKKVLESPEFRDAVQAFRGTLYIQDGKWWTGERQLSGGDVLYLVKVGRIERIYVLAGNYQQMQFYLRKMEIDPKRAVYLRELRQLRGLHQPTVIVCGTANERRDYAEILDWLRRRDAAVYWYQLDEEQPNISDRDKEKKRLMAEAMAIGEEGGKPAADAWVSKLTPLEEELFREAISDVFQSLREKIGWMFDPDEEQL